MVFQTIVKCHWVGGFDGHYIQSPQVLVFFDRILFSSQDCKNQYWKTHRDYQNSQD
jgi:hypothetical protein